MLPAKPISILASGQSEMPGKPVTPTGVRAFPRRLPVPRFDQAKVYGNGFVTRGQSLMSHVPDEMTASSDRFATKDKP